MPQNSLHVLDSSGDVMLTWNPNNEEELANIRATIASLKAQGFSFFLVDGSPAPEAIHSGIAALSVRRIEAEQVTAPAPAATPPPPALVDTLDIPLRAKRALKEAGKTTLPEVAAMSKEAVAGLPGIGPLALEQIESSLSAHGFQFGSTTAEPPAQRTIATRAPRGG